MKLYVLFILLVLNSSLLYAKEKIVRLAPLPMANAVETTKIFLPFINYLEKQTGLRFEIIWHKNYQDIINGLKQNKIDLAYLGPLPYVVLKSRSSHVKPLVGFYEKNGQKGYRCVLIASRLDKIPKNLKHKTLALTQPSSTCGYFLTKGLLKKRGANIDNMRFRYEKKHTKVVDAVLQGRYLLGGVKDSIAQKYEPLGLYILEKSKQIPSFTLVANTKTLDKKSIKLLKNTLLSTPKEEYSLWGDKISNGMFEAKQKDFKHILKAYKSMNIPQKGNF